MFVPLQELPSRVTELMPDGTVTLCCVPYDTSEYDPERLQMHAAALEEAAKAGKPLPFIYDGSVPERCRACDVRVGVGPTQQLALASAQTHEIGVNILCLLCGAVLTATAEVSIPLVNLGNPQEPPR